MLVFVTQFLAQTGNYPVCQIRTDILNSTNMGWAQCLRTAQIWAGLSVWEQHKYGLGSVSENITSMGWAQCLRTSQAWAGLSVWEHHKHGLDSVSENITSMGWAQCLRTAQVRAGGSVSENSTSMSWAQCLRTSPFIYSPSLTWLLMFSVFKDCTYVSVSFCSSESVIIL